MPMKVRMLLILLLANVVAGKTMLNESLLMIGQVLLILNIILGSIIVVIILISAIYISSKSIKRKLSQPHYYIEEKPSVKEYTSYDMGYDDIRTEIPNIMAIKPSLSIPHMAASVKQSMIDLRDSLRPFH